METLRHIVVRIIGTWWWSCCCRCRCCRCWCWCAPWRRQLNIRWHKKENVIRRPNFPISLALPELWRRDRSWWWCCVTVHTDDNIRKLMLRQMLELWMGGCACALDPTAAVQLKQQTTQCTQTRALVSWIELIFRSRAWVSHSLSLCVSRGAHSPLSRIFCSCKAICKWS